MESMGAPVKKKCRRGHALTKMNLYLRKDGTRECRKCSLVRARDAEKEK